MSSFQMPKELNGEKEKIKRNRNVVSWKNF